MQLLHQHQASPFFWIATGWPRKPVAHIQTVSVLLLCNAPDKSSLLHKNSLVVSSCWFCSPGTPRVSTAVLWKPRMRPHTDWSWRQKLPTQNTQSKCKQWSEKVAMRFLQHNLYCGTVFRYFSGVHRCRKHHTSYLAGEFTTINTPHMISQFGYILAVQ